MPIWCTLVFMNLILQIFLGGPKGNPTTEKPNHATENEPETGLYLYKSV